MTNAEWMIKNGYDFTKLSIELSFESYSYKVFLDRKYIATVTAKDMAPFQALLLWLNQEHTESILNEKEKQYLSAVIKPFRDRVLVIIKLSEDDIGMYFIEITVDTNGREQAIDLPYFCGGMYEGMEANQGYTLKELGL